jgi:hypothetical protein
MGLVDPNEATTAIIKWALATPPALLKFADFESGRRHFLGLILRYFCSLPRETSHFCVRSQHGSLSSQKGGVRIFVPNVTVIELSQNQWTIDS